MRREVLTLLDAEDVCQTSGVNFINHLLWRHYQKARLFLFDNIKILYFKNGLAFWYFIVMVDEIGFSMAILTDESLSWPSSITSCEKSGSNKQGSAFPSTTSTVKGKYFFLRVGDNLNHNQIPKKNIHFGSCLKHFSGTQFKKEGDEIQSPDCSEPRVGFHSKSKVFCPFISTYCICV